MRPFYFKPISSLLLFTGILLACSLPSFLPGQAKPTPTRTATLTQPSATPVPPTATRPPSPVPSPTNRISPTPPPSPISRISPVPPPSPQVESARIYCPTQNEQARQAFNTGNTLSQQGKLDDAKAAYLKAIELDPNYCDAMDNLGRVYRRQNDLEQAIAWYKKSIGLNAVNPVAHQNLAVAYLLQKKYAEAIGEYQTLVRLDPNDPEGHYGLGMVYLQQNRPQEALPPLLRAEELYVARGSAYVGDARYQIGIAYYALKEWSKARDYLEQASPAMKDTANWNYALGVCYLYQSPRNVEQARKYLNRAKELGAQIPDAVLQELNR